MLIVVKGIEPVDEIIIRVDFTVQKHLVKRHLLLAGKLVHIRVHLQAQDADGGDEPQVQNHAPRKYAEHLVQLDGPDVELRNKRHSFLN